MLEFIRENYSQILTLIFIIICIVLMIVSLFQKDDENKKEFSLVLFKEEKHNSENNKNSNTYALIRKYMLIYQIILYDNNGKEIFYSNFYYSRLKAINDFEKLKDNILSSKIEHQETMDHFYYGIFIHNNEMIGYTEQFDTLSKLENAVKSILDNIETPLNNISQFDESLEPVDRHNKPRRIRNIEIEKDSLDYEINLKYKNTVVLKSFETKDKNFAKNNYNDLEEALLNKRIFIEKIGEKYRYIILSNKYSIVSFGPLKNTKEEILVDIEELYLSLN